MRDQLLGVGRFATLHTSLFPPPPPLYVLPMVVWFGMLTCLLLALGSATCCFRAPSSPGFGGGMSIGMEMGGAGGAGWGSIGAGSHGVSGGMKIDFDLDGNAEEFIDVDTLLGMEDSAMLLGSYYSPPASGAAALAPHPSALESMVTTVVPALHSVPALHTSRPHLSPPIAAGGMPSPMSAAGSAVRRSFRLTPKKTARSPTTAAYGNRSPYRGRRHQFDSPLRFDSAGTHTADTHHHHGHAAGSTGGSSGNRHSAARAGGAHHGDGGREGVYNMYKSPTYELNQTYDAMNLGISPATMERALDSNFIDSSLRYGCFGGFVWGSLHFLLLFVWEVLEA
jgi:hypothetical protein